VHTSSGLSILQSLTHPFLPCSSPSRLYHGPCDHYHMTTAIPLVKVSGFMLSTCICSWNPRYADPRLPPDFRHASHQNGRSRFCVEVPLLISPILCPREYRFTDSRCASPPTLPGFDLPPVLLAPLWPREIVLCLSEYHVSRYRDSNC
jgi:hypothetical protein